MLGEFPQCMTLHRIFDPDLSWEGRDLIFIGVEQNLFSRIVQAHPARTLVDQPSWIIEVMR